MPVKRAIKSVANILVEDAFITVQIGNDGCMGYQINGKNAPDKERDLMVAIANLQLAMMETSIWCQQQLAVHDAISSQLAKSLESLEDKGKGN